MKGVVKEEMTEAEFEKKKEEKRLKRNEYMRKRREDPEFLAKQRKYCIESNKKRLETDNEFREKRRAYSKEYSKEYYKKNRDAYKTLQSLKISEDV